MEQTAAGELALTEALTCVDNKEGHPWQVELHRLKGELLLAHAANQHSAAEIYFQQALDVACHQQANWIPGSWNVRMVYTDAIPFYDP